MVGKICPSMKFTPPCTLLPHTPLRLNVDFTLLKKMTIFFFSYSLISQISKITIDLELKLETKVCS